MGSETARGPNKPRPFNFDERDEGEGEDVGEPLAEVVEEEGTVKEEAEWVAWIVVRNSVWDGNVGRTAGEGYAP